MQLVELIGLAAVAYFIGAIPAAFLVVKWRWQVDIRDYGSGQVGASNVFRSFSRGWGIGVFIYDTLKGTGVVLLARWLGLEVLEQTIAGVLVVVGHNWPVFLGFNAGRGVAATLGVTFVLNPWNIVIFAAGALGSWIVRSSALPTLFGLLAMPIVSWLMGYPPETTWALAALFLLMLIRRLTAPRRDKVVKAGLAERLLARFLFDRDTLKRYEWKTHGSDKFV